MHAMPRPGPAPARHAARATALVVVLLAVACTGGSPAATPTPADAATSATSATSAASERRIVRRPDTPPRVISSQPLRISIMQVVRDGQGMPRSSRQPDLWYSVIVEADGRPDFASLKVGGREGVENRDVIRSWLTTVKFAPAIHEGVPVAAEFRVPR